jgi:DEAD/DEAH box helicase domain-containing protein
MKQTLVFDLESLKGPEDFPEGWKHPKQDFGLALGVTYCIETKVWRVYKEEQARYLIGALTKADRVITWNGDNFDFTVLEPYGLKPADVKSFDMARKVHEWTKTFSKGFYCKLQNAAMQNIGRGKSGNGADSLVWWRNGEWKRVARYCAKDVAVTRDVYLKCLEQGGFWLPGRKREDCNPEWSPKFIAMVMQPRWMPWSKED